MAHYMLKSYDMRGRLIDRFEFGAPDDVEAEGAVCDLDKRPSLELWCGRRWVRSWPPRVRAA